MHVAKLYPASGPSMLCKEQHLSLFKAKLHSIAHKHKYTILSLSNSPWRGGDFSLSLWYCAACQEHGNPGIEVSLWGGNFISITPKIGTVGACGTSPIGLFRNLYDAFWTAVPTAIPNSILWLTLLHAPVKFTSLLFRNSRPMRRCGDLNLDLTNDQRGVKYLFHISLVIFMACLGKKNLFKTLPILL